MREAIEVARAHLGRTGTNPSVGTVLVQDTSSGPEIVGRGVTAIGGRPHAEAGALAEAGERARGATAYVTLEPCAHHGRTPPCALALVNAGIKRVVAATTDPDDRVSGRGFEILRTAGIEVTTGILADEAEYDLAGYLMQRRNGRAHVTLKLAVSQDGHIGRSDGGQIKITGPKANQEVHLLRSRVDAIVVGIGTAKADNPLLTSRLVDGEGHSPHRIILDRDLEIEPTSRLVETAIDVPLTIATARTEQDDKRLQLARAGVQFMAVAISDNRIAIPEFLEDLAARGLSSVLLEGGAEIARSFLAEDCVDRLILYQSPDPLAGTGPVIRSPVPPADHLDGFALHRAYDAGPDRVRIFERQR